MYLYLFKRLRLDIVSWFTNKNILILEILQKSLGDYDEGVSEVLPRRREQGLVNVFKSDTMVILHLGATH